MRHAKPENPGNTLYSNLPGFILSEDGRLQAREAGEFMSKKQIDIICSSPRERTHETASIVGSLNVGNPKIITDERIRDIGMGSFQGKILHMDWKKNRQKYLDMQEAGGEFETPVTIQSRMVETFKEILNKYPDKNTLFVSHGDPIDYLLQWLEGKQLQGISQHPVSKTSIWELGEAPPIVVKKIFEPTIK